MNDKPIAILCADLHLSHAPPTARSAEKDWYVAMARPLREVKLLAANLDVPVLCAGDVFHKWNSPPELINFAIDELPKMRAIPGQHDMPHHNYEDIRQSAYWTLVKAGKVSNLPWGTWTGLNKFWISPFRFGVEFGPLSMDKGGGLRIALVHRYLWTDKIGGFPGAPAESNLKAMREQLKGYDVAVFGDNHQQFGVRSGDCTVWNCGCLIRRSIAERDYRPAVGLLKADGKVEAHRLDTSEDKWVDELPEEGERKVEGLDEFLSTLDSMAASSLDFGEAMRRFLMDKTDDDVKRILEGVMG